MLKEIRVNTMFNINDVVFHKKIGLCVIKENTIINNIDYYVLDSNNDKSKIMIPVNNAGILIRNLYSKEKIEKLKKDISNYNAEIIYDFKLRVKYYDESLKSGDIEQLAKLVKSIYNQKQNANLTTADKEILKKAEELLYSEISYVMKIDEKDVKKYLYNK